MFMGKAFAMVHRKKRKYNIEIIIVLGNVKCLYEKGK